MDADSPRRTTDTTTATLIRTRLATVKEEIGRTDTKAASLLSAGGILAAGLGITTATGHVNTAATALAATLLAAALILSALVIRPRLANRDKANFIHWATLHRDQLVADTAAETADSQGRAPDQLIALSTLCLAKMRLLRWATDATIGAAAAIALAAALRAAG